MEPHSDYHADNSHSDLSDILEEEEEEDLYSDHLGEAKARGYTVGANRVKKLSALQILQPYAPTFAQTLSCFNEICFFQCVLHS